MSVKRGLSYIGKNAEHRKHGAEAYIWTKKGGSNNDWRNLHNKEFHNLYLLLTKCCFGDK
jgi:hypothetical protein